MQQFDRRYELTILPPDGVASIITELAVDFEVRKTLHGMPNLATVKIWNPNSYTLGQLRRKYTRMILNCGYGTELRLVFIGDVRNVTQSKESVDRIITVYAADGGQAYENARFNKTFDTGISTRAMFEEVAATLGDIGDLSGIPNNIDKIDGVTYSGSSAAVLNEIAGEYNAEWSVQDGTVNALATDAALQDSEVFLVSATSGMIGSPTVTNRGANVELLLNPQLVPGQRFAIDATGAEVQLGNLFFRTENVRTDASGIYKIQNATMKGNSRTGQWKSSLEGVRI